MTRSAPIVVPWVLLALAATSCVRSDRPVAYDVVAPDGYRALHIRCGRDEGLCYRLAGQRCPYGYAIRSTGTAAGSFLVRCQARRASPAVRAAYPIVGSSVASPYSSSRRMNPYASTGSALPSTVPRPSTGRPADGSGVMDPLLKYPWPSEEDLGY